MEKEREEKDAEIYWSYWITNELHPIYPDEPRLNQKEMSIWNELYGVWTSFNQLINMFLVKQTSKSSSRATAHSTAFDRWYNMRSLPAKASTRKYVLHCHQRTVAARDFSQSIACKKIFLETKSSKCRSFASLPRQEGRAKEDRGKTYIDHLLHDWSASLKAIRRRLTMAGLI